MDMDYAKRKALIIQLFRCFPSSQAGLTEGNIDAYIGAVSDMGVEALERSVNQFSRGLVERNNAFAPSAPELAEHVRIWHKALAPSTHSKALHHGTLSINFGGLNIDTRGTTNAEMDFIMKHKRLPRMGEMMAIENKEDMS